MSESRWREILLSELATIKIVCQHRVLVGNDYQPCGAVVQVPLDKLAAVRKCSICENYLHPQRDRQEDPFLKLEPVLRELQQLSGARLSFIVPLEESP